MVWWSTIRMSRDMKKKKKKKKSECAPSEVSDQLGHPPSLIRVFAVRMKKPWVLSYHLSAQRRLGSDWADAQADLSFRWAYGQFVGFVMRRLISDIDTVYNISLHSSVPSDFGPGRIPGKMNMFC